MIRIITLAIGWVLLPLAIISVAWGIAKDFIEEKVDE